MGALKNQFVKKISAALLLSLALIPFQNCAAQKTLFASAEDPKTLSICSNVSCDLSPLTNKPAVTTILMALGSDPNSQLTEKGSSAQFIAESLVRYSSPKENPKVLLIIDSNSQDEDSSNADYVRNSLLLRYDVTTLVEDSSGVDLEDMAGYDLVWLNNPGRAMGSEKTRDSLLQFDGGVIIQGDDLAQGKDFSTESLTGLKYIDNGTHVVCDGQSYLHDDYYGEEFRVTLDPAKIPGVDTSVINFSYGNDIDNTEIARSDLEVLATAVGGPSVCNTARPVIVRYLR